MFIGVDVGGTFTDVVGYRPEAGRLWATKVSTTPGSPDQGVMQGVRAALGLAALDPSAVAALRHGTTVATNAILERRGARLGILTTAGFEDTLIIGRMKRGKLYDLALDPETPLFLAPRRRIRGIRERIGPRGEVLVPLDEADVAAAARLLVQKHQVEAIAVSYLFAFANPEHERRTREIVLREAPHVYLSLSSEVDPRFREYERLVTTAFDAYIKPAMAMYLAKLRAQMVEAAIPARLQIMQSRGGIADPDTILDRPITAVASGPAAGVIGAAHAAGLSGYGNLITLDIGGTSCDVSLVHAGQPLVSTEGRLGDYPLRVPSIDVRSIGAGGGSVAWLDEAGGLRVGPHSAGAAPGPACYGLGGGQPTVTDAGVVLGYLNPEYFAGGRLRLQPELAHQAIRERIARPLGLTVPQAAAGIHRILNAAMAEALSLVSLRRGHDPREFALVAFGGAGPVHAGRLAAELGVPCVIVPSKPGVLSAYGLLVADVQHEVGRTFRDEASRVDLAEMRRAFAELDAACTEKMQRDQVPLDRVRVARLADVRYVGQSSELRIPIEAGPLGAASIERLVEAFHRTHLAVYGYRWPQAVEIVNIAAVHSCTLPKPAAPPLARPRRRSAPRPKGVRPAYFDECGESVEAALYERDGLAPGQAIRGPAIVEQADTTTVIYPGQRAALDLAGNLIVRGVGGSRRRRPG
jgi:N-methylhydantoinase A/oxoprolinase/acetone carboxylase beta subunit